MIVFTAACGAYLAASSARVPFASWHMVDALLGIGAVSAGAAAANQLLERRSDALMKRTATRPLVTGRISPVCALSVAASLVLGGTAFLLITTNPLAAALTLLTAFLYVAIYTPLKKLTPYCTAIGAIPGAMPILLGWVAMRGRVDAEAVLLFALVFFWQFPHFHSIALLYAEEYRRAGIRMLPAVEQDGESTRRQILVYSVVLFAVAILPFATHMSGWRYALAASLPGLFLFRRSLHLFQSRLAPRTPEARVLARQVLRSTLLYLPLVLAALVIDHVW